MAAQTLGMGFGFVIANWAGGRASSRAITLAANSWSSTWRLIGAVCSEVGVAFSVNACFAEFAVNSQPVTMVTASCRFLLRSSVSLKRPCEMFDALNLLPRKNQEVGSL